MRRLHIFLFVLVITLAVLVTLAVVSWYFAATSPSYYSSSWMSQMWGSNGGSNGGMGGMMGNNGTNSSAYLWIIPVALIAVVSAAIIGVGFYLVYPELRYIRGSCNPQTTGTVAGTPKSSVSSETSISAATPTTSTATTNCDVLLKTMTPEEQKVFNVLLNHQGKYLQKYVVKEANLNRLKTHRIVARFAQRGIVTVKEFGNTNEIMISDWVKSSSSPKTNTL